MKPITHLIPKAIKKINPITTTKITSVQMKNGEVRKAVKFCQNVFGGAVVGSLICTTVAP
jgi:hypothetical protein